MRAIKRLLKDDFVKNSAVFFVGSMIAAFLGYVYHPVLGRLLNINDFGELQTIISIFTQMSIIMAAFSVVTVNITANAANDKEKNLIITELRRILLVLVSIIFVAIIIGSRWLEAFFNFQTYYPFLALAFLFPLGALLVFRNGYLQGVGRFKALSASSILAAAGRLVFAVIFVLLGWRSFGAVCGLVLAQLAVLFYVWKLTKDDLVYIKDAEIDREFKNKKVRREVRYGFLVLVSSGCIAFMNSADITVVKHYFASDIAGMYSGVSLIAKIIFFATAPIISVMLPAIKINNNIRQNGKIFIKSLLLVLLIGGGVFLTFSLFSDTVIHLMMGAKYLPAAHLLPGIALFIMVISLDNLLVNYFLALRRYYLIGVMVLCIIIITVLNAFNHGSLETIINNFLLGSLFIFSLLLMAMGLEIYKSREKDF